MNDSFIAEHGAIITALMVLMFGVAVAYTLWVVVLDIRETRADAEAAERDPLAAWQPPTVCTCGAWREGRMIHQRGCERVR